MEFRIAETFTESLSRLTGEEQKAVKTTAFDLQLNPANPGMSFHKLDRARDKKFWSVRVNSDIRMIVHRSEASLLLCFVGHHDKAYEWAERRKLETHPKTGAAQLVEIRETVREIVVPVYVEEEPDSQPGSRDYNKFLFTTESDEELLGYGVPIEWLTDVRVATEHTIFTLVDHLPSEAAEALLELATGGQPRAALPTAKQASPFEHPDAQRRFRVMSNVQELERALDFPWEKWAVFLHPEQREWIEKDFSGPARVAGSAGTGKTIVALHRAAHLARANPDARVLLTTFSDTLANALQTKLKRLLGSEPRLAERIDVHSLNSIGLRLYKTHVGAAKIAEPELLRNLIKAAASSIGGHKFSLRFLLAEWEHVVDAWQLENWEAYRDVARLGRKTRLPEPQRKVLWSIFERVKNGLEESKVVTHANVFRSLATEIPKNKMVIFDFAVVDEAQDISVTHLQFLGALGGGRPNALFFAGDLGQRIFQQPFSWKALGVDVRGRSRTLRVNYRTSHQIRMQADRLLGKSVVDIDGNVEDRSDAVSVFNGPQPTIHAFKSETEESTGVAAWVSELTKLGVEPHEVGLFVRSDSQLERAQAAIAKTGTPFKVLDEHVESTHGHISIGTMHLAKGLEFRAVIVMACDDEIIPLQERIETVGDDADLQEVYDTERHLLYVACTRARDHLLVTGVVPVSEFLADMQA
jgi:mRNA-degrading endonuclease RelE of RelBE toxin-antitoxin system